MIQRLYWDEIDVVPSWAPALGRVLVLVPGPADHDECLANAGFDHFGETDESWHRELSELIGRALALGERLGAPRLATGELPVQARLLDRLFGPGPTLLDTIVCATTYDDCAPCRVDFGEPPRMALRAAGGRSVLWVWEQSPESDAETTAARLAWPIASSRLQLRWQALL